MELLSKVNSKIPLNENSHFEITLNEWNYSLDINLSTSSDVNVTNLYLIFKSYLLKEEILLKYIFLVAKNENLQKNAPIFYKISIKKLKYYNFRDFYDWFQTIYEEDYHYFKEYKYYGFRLVFFKESVCWQEKSYFPIYPWNKLLLSKLYLKHNEIYKI